MAMSTAGLKAVIIANLDAIYGTAEDSAVQAKFAEAMAKSIVEYIQGNAVVDLSASTAGGNPITPTTASIL